MKAIVDVSLIAPSELLMTTSSLVFDLNELFVAAGIWDELTGATGINDRGQIIGTGLIDGERHGFLLTPVPEPSTVWLYEIALV